MTTALVATAAFEGAAPVRAAAKAYLRMPEAARLDVQAMPNRPVAAPFPSEVTWHPSPGRGAGPRPRALARVSAPVAHLRSTHHAPRPSIRWTNVDGGRFSRLFGEYRFRSRDPRHRSESGGDDRDLRESALRCWEG